MSLEIQVHSRIGEIDAVAWNTLIRNDYPFLRHEFLHALERHGCVGEHSGWLPRHIALYDGGCLLGALPLYEKHNSRGEFVFDHAWADAYQQAGLRYYPKLLSAIPYTPATGQRFLAPEEERKKVLPLLLEGALDLAHKTGASGFHCLFPLENDRAWLEERGLLTRDDCQFHWHNRGYRSFDDFLAQMNAKKRKNIRRERRRVQQAGVTIQVFDGDTASDEAWRDFDRFYRAIYDRKWGFPALNYEFFHEVAHCLPQQMLLVLAERAGRTIAGALMYHDSKTLYGRYWGCREQVDSLHFEVCYYQGIEYCIREGLQRFEPGAQGEHKLARGFLPTVTHSCHWIAPSPYRQAIARFIEHERAAVGSYCDDATRHSPYKIESA